MGFLRKLFGADNRKPKDNGVYLYFRSKRAADAVTKIRIEPTYDLNRDGNGYSWHKTIVDSRYFSRIEAIVRFDSNYQVISADLDNGEIITAEAYDAVMEERNRPTESGDESPSAE